MTTTTQTGALLNRDEIWSRELKDVLYDDLMMGQGWVKMLSEFPDGDLFTIPSVGDVRVDDYEEDTDAIYRPLDTGEFQFQITEYLSSGTYITRKQEQDSFYTSQIISSFVPKQRRAIMEHYETETLKTPETILGASANGQYKINDAVHRMSGGNAGRMETEDFAYALHALKKANVPQSNLVAIVDPSVEFEMNTLTNLSNVSDNPRWEGIVADGIATGMKFVKNIYGFDVYTSNYLADVTDSALPERDETTTNDFSSNNGKANLFFSAAPDVLPFIAAWRQEPTVDYEFNKDKQRHEYLTTARYGTKLYRPENMVVIATNPVVS
jgi:hypothetical protein